MPEIEITIKQLKEAKECTVKISSAATVGRLKNSLHALLNVLPVHQRLVFMGKALTDSDILDKVGIKTGSKLHLIIKRKPDETAAGGADAGGTTTTNGCWLTPDIETELHRALRPHFTDPDCRKIMAEFSKNLSRATKVLSLDEVERLAVAKLTHNSQQPIVDI